MLPELGDLVLAEVRARHVVDLFHKLRTDRDRDRDRELRERGVI